MEKKVNVLDHGFVQLLDVMGSDQAIVDAARLSVSGEGVKTVSENTGLIRYLMRHYHWTPFEMVEMKFMMKMPIFVARQFVRHRTANINEMSARYSELPEEYYVPKAEDVCFQAKKNKQGRAEAADARTADLVRRELEVDAAHAFRIYHAFLGREESRPSGWGFSDIRPIIEGGGIARELARINLPLSAYTQWVWKCDLRNIFNFLRLRMDPHAQMEIRVFADAMAQMVKQVVPIAYEAFEDYHLHAMTFSRQEVDVLSALLRQISSVEEAFPDLENDSGFPTKREAVECGEKLRKIMSLGGAA